ncbi:MAG: spermidine/putrescine ABC transporter substrate-binding protein [Thermostichales cyanobacterium BF4_bins_65]
MKQRLGHSLFTWLLLVVVLSGSLLWSGCQRTTTAQQTLNLYIWSEYIDPEIVSDFEKLTNSRVIINLYESNEDMVAKLQGGGVSQYDVVVPTDYIVPTMIELNLLQPLQKDLLPNMANLDPAFTNADFDPENQYTIPYQWGTTGIAYHRGRLTADFPQSWGLIFDPALQQGPFVLIDDQRPMISSAAVYLGLDPNTTDPDDLNQIQELLLQTKRRSAGFIGGVGGKNQLLAGSANVAIVYSGDALRAAEEDEDIQYFIPEEGANIWMDNLAIPAQAPNVALAHQFINYILDPQVGARLSNYNRYPTPNKAALPLITPEDLQNPAIYPDETKMEKLFFFKPLEGENARLIDAVWTKVKSG